MSKSTLEKALDLTFALRDACDAVERAGANLTEHSVAYNPENESEVKMAYDVISVLYPVGLFESKYVECNSLYLINLEQMKKWNPHLAIK